MNSSNGVQCSCFSNLCSSEINKSKETEPNRKKKKSKDNENDGENESSDDDENGVMDMSDDG